ncbi:hypothetical protein B0H12DRAFT_1134431 [Mycena haematopus]|nr:hypothetical protein B0H12DRAFT_1134431 [Mycena haematopus]
MTPPSIFLLALSWQLQLLRPPGTFLLLNPETDGWSGVFTSRVFSRFSALVLHHVSAPPRGNEAINQGTSDPRILRQSHEIYPIQFRTFIPT